MRLYTKKGRTVCSICSGNGKVLINFYSPWKKLDGVDFWSDHSLEIESNYENCKMCDGQGFIRLDAMDYRVES